MNQSAQKIPEAETAELSRKKNFGPMIYGTLIVLVIYVLSVDPAFHLARRGKISAPELHTIYAPLEYAAENCPPLMYFVQRYLELWGVHH